MPDFNPVETLCGSTRFCFTRLVNDLDALTDEQAVTSPAPDTRTAADIVSECARVNWHIGRILRNAPPSEEETASSREEMAACSNSKQKARQYLERETASLLEALQQIDPSRLGEQQKLWNREVSLFQAAQLPAMHMFYHDGQLAYIQTFFGDQENHW